jgi:serine/threonine-protein kinase
MVFTNHEGVTVYPDALAPGTEVGGWRLLERLDVGGYGAAYRGEDVARPGDFYVLKVALHAGDEWAEREVALMMTKGRHPNVVRVHACTRWPHPKEGLLVIVMDWVPGPPLHLWAETVNGTFRRLAEVGGKVAQALGTLHDRGVFHRDLKPEHIILREPDGEPVLLDFGVGWYEGAAPLTTGTLPPGTLRMRSPESIRFLWKHHEDRKARYTFQRTDELYALGVCLYRAVTGHYPFPEGMGDLAQYAIVHEQPPTPRDFNRRVPQALSDLIMRLLAKKPEERYQSGAEVHEALVAAVTFGDPKQWEASLFEWEEVAPEKEGDKPQRRIRRPAWPTQSEPRPPPRLVIPPPLAPLHRSRRGRRGRRAGEPVSPEPEQAPPAAPEPEREDARRRMARTAAYVLGVLLVLSPSLPTPRLIHGQEVAPSRPPPDIERAAAPPGETTPAAVASLVTRPKDDAVKKQQAPSLQGDTKQKGTLSPVAKWCLGAAAAANTACPGAQVRTAPEAEPCPAGAVETMAELGIGIGGMHGVGFLAPTYDAQRIPVREGFTSVKTRGNWGPPEGIPGTRGKLPGGTILRGRLLFGEGQVYGRFTEAQTPTGDTYKVCLEVWDRGKRGVAMEPGSGKDTVKIWSNVDVKAVDRFE